MEILLKQIHSLHQMLQHTIILCRLCPAAQQVDHNVYTGHRSGGEEAVEEQVETR